MKKYRVEYEIPIVYSSPETGHVIVEAIGKEDAKQEARNLLWRTNPAVEYNANMIRIMSVQLAESDDES